MEKAKQIIIKKCSYNLVSVRIQNNIKCLLFRTIKKVNSTDVIDVTTITTGLLNMAYLDVPTMFEPVTSK